ncbi:unnamed protein product [Blepharisma stoltei]|uniref:Uncharacterized protein n=1 Tax=Blepharisma stoltei TaxID=1481888 RepID=A0AAU9INI0_9CILI|nr:unnamed protein product [Blepharisma stoltei]
MATHKKKQRIAKAVEAVISNDPYFHYTTEDTTILLEANNWTLLHLAVWLNKEIAIKKILELKPNIEALDSNGETALHLAEISQNDDIYKLLKVVGANDTIKSKYGKGSSSNGKLIEIDLCNEQAKKIEVPSMVSTVKSTVSAKNEIFLSSETDELNFEKVEFL